MFILCHAVRWIPNLWEFTQTEKDKVRRLLCYFAQYFGQKNVTWPPWVQQVSQVSHLLTVLNSSVNFYIYSIKHWQRERVRQLSIRIDTEMYLSTEVTESILSLGSPALVSKWIIGTSSRVSRFRASSHYSHHSSFFSLSFFPGCYFSTRRVGARALKFGM